MYVSPASWIPWLSTITVQPFVAGLASAFTLPRFLTRTPFKVSPQLVLFLLFSAYLAISPALHGWFGGVFESLPGGVVAALLLFLVPLNCDTSARRKIVAIAFMCAMLGLVIPGIRDYHVAPEQSKFVLGPNFEEEGEAADANVEAPPVLYRLKAQGLVDDPNDFAQLLLVIISLSFLWWGRSWLRNVLFVLLPGAILAYGVFLTHSRGALVAIAVMIAVVFRRKLKWVGSFAIAGLVAFALLASNFTGGREVSTAGGEDRLDLWSEGWQLLKQSPLIGYGWGGYVDAVNMTAHNSFLLVAVDTGVIGLTLWVSVFVISYAQINRIVTPSDGTPPDPVLRRHALCLEGAITAFLATSWFLSRAYHPLSFLLVGLLGGLACQESIRRPDAVLTPPMESCLIRSVAASVAALIMIYVMVRLRGT
jgi:hypothetical protein